MPRLAGFSQIRSHLSRLIVLGKKCLGMGGILIFFGGGGGGLYVGSRVYHSLYEALISMLNLQCVCNTVCIVFNSLVHRKYCTTAYCLSYYT